MRVIGEIDRIGTLTPALSQKEREPGILEILPFSMDISPNRRPKVAVIGGGITGLAAAHRLTELAPQAEVTLFESSDRLGGILRTVRQNGFLVEQSADSFITNIPAAIELCRRIGFADQLIPTNSKNRRATVVAHGKLERVPEGFVLMLPQRIGPVLRSPILSRRGKIRFLRERFVPPRESDDDESLASFARRRYGNEVFKPWYSRWLAEFTRPIQKN